VRHPLYAAATTTFVALGVIAANWFLIAMALVAIALVRALVIPREETQLIERFGDEYRHYISRTGALIPRLRR
jgi:protein-S-isoprenylcysteine O-methyltransferase Ste14